MGGEDVGGAGCVKLRIGAAVGFRWSPTGRRAARHPSSDQTGDRNH